MLQIGTSTDASIIARPAPTLPRNVWILGFVSLLMDLSSEIYHALLPLFITVTLGLPVAMLGAIDGVAEATASFAKLASGRLSDRSRRRKPSILPATGWPHCRNHYFRWRRGLSKSWARGSPTASAKAFAARPATA